MLSEEVQKEEHVILTPAEKLESRFAQAGLTSAKIVEKLLRTDTGTIAGFKEVETGRLFQELKELLKDKGLEEGVKKKLEEYLKLERELSGLWQKEEFLHQEEALKKELLEIVSKEKDFRLKEKGLEDIKIVRGHGSIGILLTTEQLVKLGKVKLEVRQKGKTKTLRGKEATAYLLNHPYAKLAFTPDLEELRRNTLPRGTRIVLLQNTGREKDWKEALAHEDSEFLSSFFEEMLDETEVIKRLKKRQELNQETPPLTKIKRALEDLAARIENGEVSDLYPGKLGITGKFKKKHPEEVRMLKLILWKVTEKLGSDSDAFELAGRVRSGILNPRKLVENLYRAELEKTTLEELIKNTEIEDRDFYGEHGTGAVFTSERKGRFVYNRETLKSGDILEGGMEIKYKIDKKIAEGGYGVVYLAQEIGANNQLGRKVIIKELIFNAPEALIINESTAKSAIRDIADGQVGVFSYNKLLSDLMNYAGLLDQKNASYKFRMDYRRFIDVFLKNVDIRDDNGKLLYLGNLQFATIDSSGRDVDDLAHPEIMKSITLAVSQFAVQNMNNAYLSDELKSRINKFTQEYGTINALKDIEGVVGSVELITDRSAGPGNPKYNCMYMVLEYIEGITVEEMYASSAVDIKNTAKLTCEVLDILDKMHKKDYIHRDIKPANIMIDLQGNVHLVDLGSAKAEATKLDLARQHGIRGKTSGIGTVGYAPPEQYEGRAGAVPQSDLFALGIMLFELLTGADPSRLQNKIPVVKYQQIEAELAKHPNIPEEVKDVILKAVKVNIGERFQSSQEMRQALEDCLHEPALGAFFPKDVKGDPMVWFKNYYLNLNDQYLQKYNGDKLGGTPGEFSLYLACNKAVKVLENSSTIDDAIGELDNSKQQASGVDIDSLNNIISALKEYQKYKAGKKSVLPNPGTSPAVKANQQNSSIPADVRALSNPGNKQNLRPGPLYQPQSPDIVQDPKAVMEWFENRYWKLYAKYTGLINFSAGKDQKYMEAARSYFKTPKVFCITGLNPLGDIYFKYYDYTH